MIYIYLFLFLFNKGESLSHRCSLGEIEELIKSDEVGKSDFYLKKKEWIEALKKKDFDHIQKGQFFLESSETLSRKDLELLFVVSREAPIKSLEDYVVWQVDKKDECIKETLKQRASFKGVEKFGEESDEYIRLKFINTFLEWNRGWFDSVSDIDIDSTDLVSKKKGDQKECLLKGAIKEKITPHLGKTLTPYLVDSCSIENLTQLEGLTEGRALVSCLFSFLCQEGVDECNDELFLKVKSLALVMDHEDLSESIQAVMVKVFMNNIKEIDQKFSLNKQLERIATLFFIIFEINQQKAPQTVQEVLQDFQIDIEFIEKAGRTIKRFEELFISHLGEGALEEAQTHLKSFFIVFISSRKKGGIDNILDRYIWIEKILSKIDSIKSEDIRNFTLRMVLNENEKKGLTEDEQGQLKNLKIKKFVEEKVEEMKKIVLGFYTLSSQNLNDLYGEISSGIKMVCFEGRIITLGMLLTYFHTSLSEKSMVRLFREYLVIENQVCPLTLKKLNEWRKSRGQFPISQEVHVRAFIFETLDKEGVKTCHMKFKNSYSDAYVYNGEEIVDYVKKIYQSKSSLDHFILSYLANFKDYLEINTTIDGMTVYQRLHMEAYNFLEEELIEQGVPLKRWFKGSDIEGESEGFYVYWYFKLQEAGALKKVNQKSGSKEVILGGEKELLLMLALEKESTLTQDKKIKIMTIMKQIFSEKEDREIQGILQEMLVLLSELKKESLILDLAQIILELDYNEIFFLPLNYKIIIVESIKKRAENPLNKENWFCLRKLFTTIISGFQEEFSPQTLEYIDLYILGQTGEGIGLLKMDSFEEFLKKAEQWIQENLKNKGLKFSLTLCIEKYLDIQENFDSFEEKLKGILKQCLRYLEVEENLKEFQKQYLRCLEEEEKTEKRLIILKKIMKIVVFILSENEVELWNYLSSETDRGGAELFKEPLECEYLESIQKKETTVIKAFYDCYEQVVKKAIQKKSKEEEVKVFDIQSWSIKRNCILQENPLNKGCQLITLELRRPESVKQCDQLWKLFKWVIEESQLEDETNRKEDLVELFIFIEMNRSYIPLSWIESIVQKLHKSPIEGRGHSFLEDLLQMLIMSEGRQLQGALKKWGQYFKEGFVKQSIIEELLSQEFKKGATEEVIVILDYIDEVESLNIPTKKSIYVAIPDKEKEKLIFEMACHVIDRNEKKYVECIKMMILSWVMKEDVDGEYVLSQDLISFCLEYDKKILNHPTLHIPLMVLLVLEGARPYIILKKNEYTLCVCQGEKKWEMPYGEELINKKMNSLMKVYIEEMRTVVKNYPIVRKNTGNIIESFKESYLDPLECMLDTVALGGGVKQGEIKNVFKFLNQLRKDEIFLTLELETGRTIPSIFFFHSRLIFFEEGREGKYREIEKSNPFYRNLFLTEIHLKYILEYKDQYEDFLKREVKMNVVFNWTEKLATDYLEAVSHARGLNPLKVYKECFSNSLPEDKISHSLIKTCQSMIEKKEETVYGSIIKACQSVFWENKETKESMMNLVWLLKRGTFRKVLQERREFKIELYAWILNQENTENEEGCKIEWGRIFKDEDEDLLVDILEKLPGEKANQVINLYCNQDRESPQDPKGLSKLIHTKIRILRLGRIKKTDFKKWVLSIMKDIKRLYPLEKQIDLNPWVEEVYQMSIQCGLNNHSYEWVKFFMETSTESPYFIESLSLFLIRPVLKGEFQITKAMEDFCKELLIRAKGKIGKCLSFQEVSCPQKMIHWLLFLKNLWNHDIYSPPLMEIIEVSLEKQDEEGLTNHFIKVLPFLSEDLRSWYLSQQRSLKVFAVFPQVIEVLKDNESLKEEMLQCLIDGIDEWTAVKKEDKKKRESVRKIVQCMRRYINIEDGKNLANFLKRTVEKKTRQVEVDKKGEYQEVFEINMELKEIKEWIDKMDRQLESLLDIDGDEKYFLSNLRTKLIIPLQTLVKIHSGTQERKESQETVFLIEVFLNTLAENNIQLQFKLDLVPRIFPISLPASIVYHSAIKYGSTDEIELIGKSDIATGRFGNMFGREGVTAYVDEIGLMKMVVNPHYYQDFFSLSYEKENLRGNLSLLKNIEEWDKGLIVSYFMTLLDENKNETLESLFIKVRDFLPAEAFTVLEMEEVVQTKIEKWSNLTQKELIDVVLNEKESIELMLSVPNLLDLIDIEGKEESLFYILFKSYEVEGIDLGYRCQFLLELIKRKGVGFLQSFFCSLYSVKDQEVLLRDCLEKPEDSTYILENCFKKSQASSLNDKNKEALNKEIIRKMSLILSPQVVLKVTQETIRNIYQFLCEVKGEKALFEWSSILYECDCYLREEKGLETKIREEGVKRLEECLKLLSEEEIEKGQMSDQGWMNLIHLYQTYLKNQKKLKSSSVFRNHIQKVYLSEKQNLSQEVCQSVLEYLEQEKEVKVILKDAKEALLYFQKSTNEEQKAIEEIIKNKELVPQLLALLLVEEKMSFSKSYLIKELLKRSKVSVLSQVDMCLIKDSSLKSKSIVGTMRVFKMLRENEEESVQKAFFYILYLYRSKKRLTERDFWEICHYFRESQNNSLRKESLLEKKEKVEEMGESLSGLNVEREKDLGCFMNTMRSLLSLYSKEKGYREIMSSWKNCLDEYKKEQGYSYEHLNRDKMKIKWDEALWELWKSKKISYRILTNLSDDFEIILNIYGLSNEKDIINFVKEDEEKREKRPKKDLDQMIKEGIREEDAEDLFCYFKSMSKEVVLDHYLDQIKEEGRILLTVRLFKEEEDARVLRLKNKMCIERGMIDKIINFYNKQSQLSLHEGKMVFEFLFYLLLEESKNKMMEELSVSLATEFIIFILGKEFLIKTDYKWIEQLMLRKEGVFECVQKRCFLMKSYSYRKIAFLMSVCKTTSQEEPHGKEIAFCLLYYSHFIKEVMDNFEEIVELKIGNMRRESQMSECENDHLKFIFSPDRYGIDMKNVMKELYDLERLKGISEEQRDKRAELIIIKEIAELKENQKMFEDMESKLKWAVREMKDKVNDTSCQIKEEEVESQIEMISCLWGMCHQCKLKKLKMELINAIKIEFLTRDKLLGLSSTLGRSSLKKMREQQQLGQKEETLQYKPMTVDEMKQRKLIKKKLEKSCFDIKEVEKVDSPYCRGEVEKFEVLARNDWIEGENKGVIQMSQAIYDVAVLAHLEKNEYEIWVDYIALNELIQGQVGVLTEEQEKIRLEYLSQVVTYLYLDQEGVNLEKVYSILQKVTQAGGHYFYNHPLVLQGKIQNVDSQSLEKEVLEKVYQITRQLRRSSWGQQSLKDIENEIQSHADLEKRLTEVSHIGSILLLSA